MMTKQKSKQIKQLKYLLLVPVLVSMLFYTACTNEVNSTQEPVAKKEISKLYYEFKDGLKTHEGKAYTYLDYYSGSASPDKNGWKEVSYNDLLEEEKLEYDDKMKRVKEKVSKYPEIFNSKLYQKPDGRKVMCDIIDFSKMKRNKTVNEDGSVPFSIIDKVPTFPGCEEGNKDCFNHNLKKFVAKNFNIKLANSLGLKTGKKRIYVQFKISKEGKVIDINARAPHPKLKEEATRIAKLLPQMKPGEKDGKKVNVGYTLPITFVVE